MLKKLLILVLIVPFTLVVTSCVNGEIEITRARFNEALESVTVGLIDQEGISVVRTGENNMDNWSVDFGTNAIRIYNTSLEVNEHFVINNRVLHQNDSQWIQSTADVRARLRSDLETLNINLNEVRDNFDTFIVSNNEGYAKLTRTASGATTTVIMNIIGRGRDATLRLSSMHNTAGDIETSFNIITTIEVSQELLEEVARLEDNVITYEKVIKALNNMRILIDKRQGISISEYNNNQLEEVISFGSNATRRYSRRFGITEQFIINNQMWFRVFSGWQSGSLESINGSIRMFVDNRLEELRRIESNFNYFIRDVDGEVATMTFYGSNWIDVVTFEIIETDADFELRLKSLSTETVGGPTSKRIREFNLLDTIDIPSDLLEFIS